MILDIDIANEGKWFTFFYSHIDPNTLEIIYDDPVENGPRMKIRNPVSLFRKRADNRQTVGEYKLNPKSRQMQYVEREKDLTPAQKAKENEEFVDFVIQEVGEGFRLGGKEIEGTLKEKVQMMENPLISMFVQRCIQILQESGIQEAREEEKNLSTGSSFQTINPDPE